MCDARFKEALVDEIEATLHLPGSLIDLLLGRGVGSLHGSLPIQGGPRPCGLRHRNAVDPSTDRRMGQPMSSERVQSL
jgi:hypothetical protein